MRKDWHLSLLCFKTITEIRSFEKPNKNLDEKVEKWVGRWWKLQPFVSNSTFLYHCATVKRLWSLYTTIHATWAVFPNAMTMLILTDKILKWQQTCNHMPRGLMGKEKNTSLCQILSFCHVPAGLIQTQKLTLVNPSVTQSEQLFQPP